MGQTYDNILLSLLDTYSEQEMQGLKQFIACDYFNKDKSLLLLLEGLQQCMAARLPLDATQRRKLFCDLFPERKAKQDMLSTKENNLLNARMSLLTRLAEQFLVIQSLQNREAYQCELLYENLLERNQFRLLQRHLRKAEKKMQQGEQNSLSFHTLAMKVKNTELHFLHKTDQLDQQATIGAVVHHLDIAYLLQKLNLYLTALTMAEFAPDQSFDRKIFDTVNEMLQIATYANHPVIRIYRTAFRMLETDDTDAYSELLQLLQKHHTSIPVRDVKDLYNTVSNFCIRQIVRGQSQYRRKLFELYLILDAKNLLLEKGFMPLKRMKNFMALCGQLREFEVALQVIKKYRPYLQQEVKHSVCSFCYGAIAFYQKNYDAALKNLHKVKKINPAYDVDCKMLILKTFYHIDKDYNEATIQYYKGAQKFIMAYKGLPTERKKAYHNFIRILINLYRLKHGTGKITFQRIKEKLKQLKLISDRKWLVEQLDS